ncbi:SMP-30/gluconolactonase/LRE family protein [Mesorhizobium sp. ANAO-SY3R2]|uniref:SMP-30/gluconolactonase/LRE family protein n=1 Tax=Mesorhizobium sp. ANAO-SY3R2 TaxID=3166644 RepID=UPI00366CACF2
MKPIARDEISFAFDGLSRPECVLCTASAGVFMSHDPIGVLHIAPDGSRGLHGRKDKVASGQFTPNGIALSNDGRLLIANTGLEGGVWQVDRAGDCRPLLMEVDGIHLYPANFVLADALGRLWISVSTRQVPRSKAYNADILDGYIVLWEKGTARIVADGLGYTNECRLSNDGAFLYVNETFKRRISRFAVGADGTLGPRETFVQLGFGDFPDGGVFDVEGHYWITSVVSNRIYRIDLDGRPHLVFEDADSDYVALAETAYREGRLSAEMLYADAGQSFNHIASITFGGADLRKAYLGTLKMQQLPFFRAPVAGSKPAHWHWSF